MRMKRLRAHGCSADGTGPSATVHTMTARLITAPEPVPADDTRSRVFLAGGITGCANWQHQAAELLADAPVVLLNPRRSYDLAMEGPEARAQIQWEHQMLHTADQILFWFPNGPSPCPIALYELGMHVGREVRLSVGCEPGYSRTFDVRTQMWLARPGLKVHETLEDLCRDVLANLAR